MKFFWDSFNWFGRIMMAGVLAYWLLMTIVMILDGAWLDLVMLYSLMGAISLFGIIPSKRFNDFYERHRPSGTIGYWAYTIFVKAIVYASIPALFIIGYIAGDYANQ